MMELLAFAASQEAAIAAVQNGADAIYIGFDGMNSCREAVNFSGREFETTVSYCHVRGCRVYLLLDILFNDREINKASGLALRAQRAGVDGIIVRDLGVFRILRQLLPEMPLFAAAEMGFATPSDVELAGQLGFRRVFLPPELPIEEVLRMGSLSVEIAVMAEGPLCACCSGSCRMSFLNGRGSASRGKCSAPCRESFSLGGRWDSTPLSFKDRSFLRSLDTLEKANVSCLYFGVQNRRPEYNATFTEYYRHAISDKKLPAERDQDFAEKAFSSHGYSAKKAAAEPIESLPGRDVEKFCIDRRKSYSGGAEARRVDVEFAIVAQGEHSRLRIGVIDTDGNKVIEDGPLPVYYGDVPLTDSALQEDMYKTSGTPYHCVNVRSAAPEGLSVSSADLAIARREILNKLSEKRGEIKHYAEGQFPPPPSSVASAPEPVFNFRFQTAEQMTRDMAAFEPQCVYAPLETLVEKPGAMEPFVSRNCTPVAVLPDTLRSEREEAQLMTLLEKAASLGIRQVTAPNLALALRAAGCGMKIRGEASLNVFNSYALKNLLDAGFLSAIVSPELSIDQVRSLAKCLPTEMVIYGRLPAMTTDSCILKTSAGRCTCSTPGQMTDGHGGVWPVFRAFGCRNTIFSSRKLFLADRAREWKNSGLWAVQLAFSAESPRECAEIAKTYLSGSGYRPNGLTLGAFYKGVN